MNIYFWAQIIVCIQLILCLHTVFVYFEYIQIFIFNLHSMAVHPLKGDGACFQFLTDLHCTELARVWPHFFLPFMLKPKSD